MSGQPARYRWSPHFNNDFDQSKHSTSVRQNFGLETGPQNPGMCDLGKQNCENISFIIHQEITNHLQAMTTCLLRPHLYEVAK